MYLCSNEVRATQPCKQCQARIQASCRWALDHRRLTSTRLLQRSHDSATILLSSTRATSLRRLASSLLSKCTPNMIDLSTLRRGSRTQQMGTRQQLRRLSMSDVHNSPRSMAELPACPRLRTVAVTRRRETLTSPQPGHLWTTRPGHHNVLLQTPPVHLQSHPGAMVLTILTSATRTRWPRMFAISTSTAIADQVPRTNNRMATKIPIKVIK